MGINHPVLFRCVRGQATLEYVAVLGVVAVVLSLAGSVSAAPAIVNGVGRAFQRSLCMVAGSGCATVDARPCTVRTTTTGGELTAKLAFVKIGGQAGLLHAERSDGTVSVTLLEHLVGGLTAGLGAGGHLRLGSVDIGEGLVAQADAVARLGGGRTWLLPGRKAAQAFEHHLAEVLVGSAASGMPVVGPVLHVAQHVLGIGDRHELPPASSKVLDARGALEASLRLGSGTSLSAALAAGVGVTDEKASGRRSVLLRVEGDAGAAIAGAIGGLSGGGTASLQITYDRARRPIELTVAANGHASSSLASAQVLPSALAGRLVNGASAATSVVLDLREPWAARLVDRVVRATSPAQVGDLLPAAHALAGALRSGGRVDVQRYGTHESAVGGGGEIGLGAEIGFDAEVTRAGTDLLDAWTRPPGGVWERRVDCLAA